MRSDLDPLAPIFAYGHSHVNEQCSGGSLRRSVFRRATRTLRRLTLGRIVLAMTDTAPWVAEGIEGRQVTQVFADGLPSSPTSEIAASAVARLGNDALLLSDAHTVLAQAEMTQYDGETASIGPIHQIAEELNSEDFLLLFGAAESAARSKALRRLYVRLATPDPRIVEPLVLLGFEQRILQVAPGTAPEHEFERTTEPDASIRRRMARSLKVLRASRAARRRALARFPQAALLESNGSSPNASVRAEQEGWRLESGYI